MGPQAVDLLTLQGKIKVDPDGYADEFAQQMKHYQACLAVFLLKPTENDDQLAELATFIAQVAYCYRQQTNEFTCGLLELLEKQAPLLNPDLRLSLVKSLILLRHRGQVAPTQTLPLFFKLFQCKDKLLRQLCFRHIVADIKNSNKKHVNEALNRQLQSFLYGVLAEDNNRAAKKSLAVLCELYRRGVWRDAKTVNVMATAVFHTDAAVMLPAVKFFLGQDQAEEEASDDEHEENDPTVGPSKEELYKAYKKGTASSKKKKQAKLKRALHTLKKVSRGEEAAKRESFAALQLLHDPQQFCEKLFARVQSGNTRYETRLLLLTLLSRIVGMHKTLLLNLYPYLQKYIQPHQRDVHTVLAALVQGCHELVPAETLSPVLRHVCNQFVHDAARPEAITSGLKTVRELCLRCPLVMTPELLQDLVGYKKYRNKVVSSAARGLMGLFRELAPGMLEKRDRGRGADISAQLKQYGELNVATRVQGAELLQADLARGTSDSELCDDDDDDDDCDDDSAVDDSDADASQVSSEPASDASQEDGANVADSSDAEAEAASAENAGAGGDTSAALVDMMVNGQRAPQADTEQQGDAAIHAAPCSSADGQHAEQHNRPSNVEGVQGIEGDDGGDEEAGSPGDSSDDEAGSLGDSLHEEENEGQDVHSSCDTDEGLNQDIWTEGQAAVLEPSDVQSRKRKQLESNPESLASLKKRLAARNEQLSAHEADPEMPIEYTRILTEEDFQRIRELRHNKLVEAAMAKHGLKSTKATAHKRDRIMQEAEEEAEEMMQFQDGLNTIHQQRVTGDDIAAKMKWRRDKAERMASVLAGREDREEYGAAAKRKKSKAGGTSNREKQKKKLLPGVARMAQIRKRQGGKRKGGAKNFQGRVCHRFRPKKK